MNRFIRSMAAGAALALAGCGMVEIIPKDVDRGPVIPEVSNTLLQLIDAQERGVITSLDYSSTSLGVISTLGTPAGFRLRLRFQELGVSLVEALKMSRDPDLTLRLIELAQWSSGRRVRAEALLTLAAFSDPKDFVHFRTALTDQDVGIRFAAIEAVEQWTGPEAEPFLREAMRDPWSPLVRVFAAQEALAHGDESGLPVLWTSLDDRSWIIRALAARYLGDYAAPSDADKLVRALDRESRNDFVVAEVAIAALKLLARQEAASDKRIAPPDPIEAKGAERYTPTADDAIEMEPLVLRPPRVRISESTRVAQTINERLQRLITDRIDQPVDPALAQDENFQDLTRLVTPQGFALQTRYSELSVAVAEGLAGTTDRLLRLALRRIAESDTNAVARATALLSLAYSRLDEDLPLLRTALSDNDPIVRFGAMEAAQVGHFRVVPALQGIAADDPVPAFRLFAIQVLLSMNEPSAYSDLVANANNQDWPARAMAYWYLGRYGRDSDYTFVLSAISREQNPFVLAEAALATQRLAPQK